MREAAIDVLIVQSAVSEPVTPHRIPLLVREAYRELIAVANDFFCGDGDFAELVCPAHGQFIQPRHALPLEEQQSADFKVTARRAQERGSRLPARHVQKTTRQQGRVESSLETEDFDIALNELGTAGAMRQHLGGVVDCRYAQAVIQQYVRQPPCCAPQLANTCAAWQPTSDEVDFSEVRQPPIQLD